MGREEDRPRSLSVTAVVWDALAGATVTAVAVLVLLAMVGPFVLSALGVDSLTIGTPGTLTELFSFSETPTEISFTVGPGELGVGAVFGVAYAFVRSYRRDKASTPEAADAARSR